MIWIFSFFLFFFFTLKDLLFFSGLFFFDSFSMLMNSISPLIMYLLLLMVFFSLNREDLMIYNYFFTFIVFVVSLCFVAQNSFLFIFLLELSVFPMFFLIFFLSKDFDKISSVFFMFFINMFGSLPFMIFSINLMNSSFFQFFFYFYLNFFFVDFFLYFCYFFIFISKLPIFLLHFWLTKAHVSASGSCSMILASLMLKLGSFGLIKFSYLFYKNFFLMSFIFFSFCLLGCIFFCVLMCRFFDIKYVIACSSVLHMSLIFPLVLSLSSFGMVSSMLMMVGHGLVSFILFYLISIVYEFSINRSSDFNKSLESLSKSLGMFLFIFLVLNLGIPPFINFLSELYFSFFLLSWSSFSMLLFCLCMILSVVFTFMLFSKFLFSKKSVFFNFDFSVLMNFNLLVFFFFSLLLVLLF